MIIKMASTEDSEITGPYEVRLESGSGDGIDVTASKEKKKISGKKRNLRSKNKSSVETENKELFSDNIDLNVSETNGISIVDPSQLQDSRDNAYVKEEVTQLNSKETGGNVSNKSKDYEYNINIGKIKDDLLKIKSRDDVPELEDAPPPSVVVQAPIRASPSPSLKLRERERNNSERKNSSNKDGDDDIQEVPVEKMEVDVIEVADGDDCPDQHSGHLEGMTVIDEVTDGLDDICEDDRKESKDKVATSNNIDPDTEMVSEDELPAESSKEQLETEAVSDEELPTTTTVDLPETEAVSEDELPPEGTEKKKKKKSSNPEAVAKTGKEVKKKEEAGVGSTKSDSDVGVKRKLTEGEYDPSSPTSEASNEETPPAKKMTTEAGKTQAKPTKPTKLPELEKYWKAVKDDPTDFTGWTYLLQYVDQENDVEAAREAYDAFLSHYPYCYGYWRKYADYEKRKGNKKKCEEVFERGLKAIPLSVDLWIHYLNYCKATYPDDEEFLRVQFKKALDACGLEFRSDRLWESFIKWETEGKRVYNVTVLYDKLLATPTQGYTNHFDNFQEHVKNNPPAKVLSVDEFLTLRREVLQVLKQYDAPLKVTEEGPPGDDDAAPPGEEPPEASAASDEETTALRERIISIRRKVHKTTVAAVSSRWTFEEGIKRPYFHVKPLERCQLKNWKEYLDFEIEQGDKERIIILFERCLIACALYEDFWIRFIRYLEELPGTNIDKIRDVYERACTIHHPKKPNLHLYWAVYEESQGNAEKAREILANLEKIVPSLMQVAFRRINLERRTGNLEEAAALYEHYISTAKSKISSNNMAIKYARFCWKMLNDVDRALAVLKKAIEKDKENPRLYLQLIDMAMQRSSVQESEVLSVIEQFMTRESADLDQKLMFAQRKVEFLEDFGSSVLLVQKAIEEFKRYIKVVKEKKKKLMEAESKTRLKSEESKKSKQESNQHSSQSTAQTSSQASQPSSMSSSTAAPGPYPQNYSTQPYPQQAPPGPGGYQGGSGQGGYPPQQQPPYATQPPYGQGPYNQSDPNYPNYQNWSYSQAGYGGGYNQGWGNYNYY
ncbi:pre-mRNA-processing factor 39-like isoform X3 [Lycorma delicatula]|uniref:pre-mRNA-processing factor 39-like isoform X3 n=1 Tax=Lycorma delicatula TaxID=130591 RepID=UPI003F51400C